MTKRYKDEVARIQKEIRSLFDYNFSKDHIVLYDFNLFLLGYHMPERSMGISWIRAILEAQSNKESKSYQKKIHRLAMNAWLDFGTIRFEVSKRIFIDTTQEMLDATQKAKLEDVITKCITVVPLDIYQENLQTLEEEEIKRIKFAHLQ